MTRIFFGKILTCFIHFRLTLADCNKRNGTTTRMQGVKKVDGKGMGIDTRIEEKEEEDEG